MLTTAVPCEADNSRESETSQCWQQQYHVKLTTAVKIIKIIKVTCWQQRYIQNDQIQIATCSQREGEKHARHVSTNRWGSTHISDNSSRNWVDATARCEALWKMLTPELQVQSKQLATVVETVRFQRNSATRSSKACWRRSCRVIKHRADNSGRNWGKQQCNVKQLIAC